MAAWAAASVAAYAALRRAARTRLGAIVLGAIGPLAALGLLRLLERAGAKAPAFLVLPFAAAACTGACASLLLRLRDTGRAATK
jgi:hypothetical protein